MTGPDLAGGDATGQDATGQDVTGPDVTGPHATGPDPGGPHATAGVVLHLSEGAPAKHRAVLRNALNLLPELPSGTPVEVVVHGEAIALARPDAEAADALQEALAAGIGLAVCRNSMRSQDLHDDDLVTGAVLVASGVAHLVARQREGWAYLRP